MILLLFVWTVEFPHRHDRTLRQPTNLKRDVSIPVPRVPFLTSW